MPDVGEHPARAAAVIRLAIPGPIGTCLARPVFVRLRWMNSPSTWFRTRWMCHTPSVMSVVSIAMISSIRAPVAIWMSASSR